MPSTRGSRVQLCCRNVDSTRPVPGFMLTYNVKVPSLVQPQPPSRTPFSTRLVHQTGKAACLSLALSHSHMLSLPWPYSVILSLVPPYFTRQESILPIYWPPSRWSFSFYLSFVFTLSIPSPYHPRPERQLPGSLVSMPLLGPLLRQVLPAGDGVCPMPIQPDLHRNLPRWLRKVQRCQHTHVRVVGTLHGAMAKTKADQHDTTQHNLCWYSWKANETPACASENIVRAVVAGRFRLDYRNRKSRTPSRSPSQKRYRGRRFRPHVIGFATARIPARVCTFSFHEPFQSLLSSWFSPEPCTSGRRARSVSKSSNAPFW